MRKQLIFALIIASLVLAACGGAMPQPTPTPEAPAPTEAAPAPEDTTSPAGEVSLATQPWQWTGFTGAAGQFKVEAPESYQVTFNEDGTVSVVADCNNAAGTYTDEDGALTVVLGPMTAAACPEGSRSEQFATLIASAASYFIADDVLFISLMADGGIYVWESRPGDPAFEGQAAPDR